MSAFVVNRSHIDALVALAVFGPRDTQQRWEPLWWYHADQAHEANPDTAHAIGELLALENVRSVQHRYPTARTLPGTHATDDAPDWLAAYDTPVEHLRRMRRPTIAEGCKLIDCYQYQSCEHDDWPTSAAHALTDTLRRALIHALPGYDDAPREWPDERALAR